MTGEYAVQDVNINVEQVGNLQTFEYVTDRRYVM